MPNLGDTAMGPTIGLKSNKRHIWTACEICGKERWVEFTSGIPKYDICFACCHLFKGGYPHGEKSWAWEGGRNYTGQGYIQVMLLPNDFFRPMVKRSGYVLEHRLVMARNLGRCLHSWELVHHKNHIRDDNRIENLQLISDDRHKQITILENEIILLKKRLSKYEPMDDAKKTEEGC